MRIAPPATGKKPFSDDLSAIGFFHVNMELLSVNLVEPERGNKM